MHTAYLGLGSNMGDRELQLVEAIKLLNEVEGIEVTQESPIYETKPIGYTEQPDFLNMCIEISTELESSELLKVCMMVEQQLHRVRVERWGPRTIDIDILLYDQSVIQSPDLEVPHPRMTERAFVMVPLNDIASNVVEPISKKYIWELLLNDEQVVKYKSERN
ncbi:MULTISPECIES: 2-amino-4-hydroxy-6-hydroxymethyldihydropteridine diphosphokinase [Mammaliicoccus]|uniref:2-amino-4-hydroxy-6-hydroxymethyldihydropteridine diphosphokinase n=1 Tax=Mammaliicoccus vitulinus TaxID=71237 RepID=A0A2T4PRN4_9STAP|nr:MULTISPECIES: 2-amino-4-hydroxy-6-hydroxymethyldihydropteridine diphosphokinase [Mammaliicoccus]HAL08606.1 2-amino-4-hydroxy-6-hydroxymethyldihydropteridine diphosphokinase [Staphylococcus sp.]MBM6630348.1 2-amino-4-hydroxy-6-hydroxymethyldihydropteridine diphosphokinase [Mammaliicoccus vitulinus]MBO3078019.1 2-amino-4-hydroxy-6-hydroxymethyldihydropteridine diphosphokinase [Mammaliicoccus vitulinus]MEB7658633.1 2-amino-4-hydroxy-6-hydroxymethyldihydropteridine diphosphokinase [Mammaliicoccu